jgi:transposase
MVFVDESGFYLLPGLVRPDAPCGRAPVLRSVFTRDHVSVMRGLTMDGRLSTLVRDHALDSLDSMVFLKHLLPHVSERLLVIWDGSPMHKGHVRTCLAEGAARQIHLAPLPAYAPDLNPGAGVRQHLKHVDMRHLGCVNLPHLRSGLRLAIKRLRRKPPVLTACVAPAGLSIETY